MQKNFHFQSGNFYWIDVVHLMGGMVLALHNPDSSFTPVGTTDKYYLEQGDIQAFQPEPAGVVYIDNATELQKAYDPAKEIVQVNTGISIFTGY